MFRCHLSLNLLKLYTFPEHNITTYFLANISLPLAVIPKKLSNTNLHPVIIFRKLPAVDDFLLVDVDASTTSSVERKRREVPAVHE